MMKIQRWGKYEKTKGMLQVTYHYMFISNTKPSLASMTRKHFPPLELV